MSQEPVALTAEKIRAGKTSLGIEFGSTRIKAVLIDDEYHTIAAGDYYKEIIAKHDERGAAAVGNIERFAFYDEAKTSYCIISTGEKALYANIMLQKGVVIND